MNEMLLVGLFLVGFLLVFSNNITHLENIVSNVDNLDYLPLNSSKTWFPIIGIPHQLAKLRSLTNYVLPTPVDCALNLGFMFDKNLLLYEHLSVISKSSLHNIRDVRRMRDSIDQSTA